MNGMLIRRAYAVVVATLAVVAILGSTVVEIRAQQQGTSNGEWPTYGGNQTNDRYSPVGQVTAENFNDLEVAWQLNTDSFGPRPEPVLQTTPLMIGRTVYATVGTRRAVVALDATTGELLWMHRLDEGERGATAPRRLSGRGLTYWDDGGDGVIFIRDARVSAHRARGRNRTPHCELRDRRNH